MRYLLLLLFPMVALAGPGNPFRDGVRMTTQGTAAVTKTSSEVLAADDKRNYLIFQNRGTGSVYIKFGSSVSSADSDSDGVEIEPGGYYEPFHSPTKSVNAIGEGGGSHTLFFGSGR